MSALTHRSLGSLKAPVVAMLLIVLAGCASAPLVTPEGQPEEPVFAYDRVVPSDVDQSLLIHDPWEPMNRSIYRFNSRVDKYFLLPLIRGYQFVFPGFLRPGPEPFMTGQALVSNAGRAPLGEVIREEKGHRFPNGLTGPAYLVRGEDGAERWYPKADLETHYSPGRN